MEQDEQTLIRQVLAGDQDAYRPLVERYHAGLIHFIYNIVWDEHAAHDIAQESFITAYQKLSSYNNQYAFSTWLYKIARNTALQHLRKQQALPLETNPNIPSDAPDLPESVDKQLNADRLRQAVRRLRPEWQTAVTLYYWQDKSYQEIADIMDAPINTIRVWLSRAKDELRSTLA